MNEILMTMWNESHSSASVHPHIDFSVSQFRSLIEVLPHFCLCNRRSAFSRLILVVTVITSVSSFVKPTANAYVLNCFGLHLAYTVVIEMRWYGELWSFLCLSLLLFKLHVRSVTLQWWHSLFSSCTDQKVLRLAKLSVVLWVLAITCWISDRFGCSFWQRLNFCYLHGIWYVLSFPLLSFPIFYVVKDRSSTEPCVNI